MEYPRVIKVSIAFSLHGLTNLTIKNMKEIFTGAVWMKEVGKRLLSITWQILLDSVVTGDLRGIHPVVPIEYLM
jgi:hypothetical protein